MWRSQFGLWENVMSNNAYWQQQDDCDVNSLSLFIIHYWSNLLNLLNFFPQSEWYSQDRLNQYQVMTEANVYRGKDKTKTLRIRVETKSKPRLSQHESNWSWNKIQSLCLRLRQDRAKTWFTLRRDLQKVVLRSFLRPRTDLTYFNTAQRGKELEKGQIFLCILHSVFFTWQT